MRPLTLLFQPWLVVLVRRPWLVTVATVVVCAGFAAHAATALVDARLITVGPEQVPSRPRPPTPPVPPAHTRPDGGQLVSRNIFCSTCPVGGTTAAPAGVPITKATLIATSIGHEPAATLAVAGTWVQGSWGVGEAIPGLGRVERIAPTWVEITDGMGRRGRLSLLEAAAGGADTAMPARPTAWSERIQKIDEQTYEVDRSLVRELVTGVTRPGGVRPVPMLEKGGVAGVKLYGVTEESIPAALGLTSGDALTAINGAPIKSLQQLFDLYAGLDQLSTVEVSGRRAGRPLVRTLRLR
jgi:hypothetical protein